MENCETLNRTTTHCRNHTPQLQLNLNIGRRRYSTSARGQYTGPNESPCHQRMRRIPVARRRQVSSPKYVTFVQLLLGTVL
jgi:hypothetical protein